MAEIRRILAPALLGFIVVSFSLVSAQKQETLLEKIAGKPSKEQAQIIAKEIVRLNPLGSFTKDATTVNIQGVEEVEGGIAVTAKAQKGGTPVGFGDGTVEIERFLFFKPRISVPDPLGSIEVKHLTKVGTQTYTSDFFREDAAEATRLAVADAIRIVGKDGSKVVKGKVGHTTATCYPDADPETTSFDGYVYTDGNGSGWASPHAATVGETMADAAADLIVGDSAGAANDNILRVIALFDCSSLPDNAVISAVTNSYYAKTKNNNDADANAWINVYQSNPASNTAMALEDYDQVGDAETNPTKGAADILMSDQTVNNYIDFTFNATGIGWVSKTAVTKLGLREGHDAVNDQPGINNAEQDMYYAAADTALTTSDPKLTVVYTTPSPAKAVIIVQR